MYNYNDGSLYDYNLLNDSLEIENNFINIFIDADKYNDFAISNPNGNVHMFDFIKGAHTISYESATKYIKNISTETYYILLNVSQYYNKKDGRFHHDYKLAEISHENLMFILNDQKNDMQGERLCYVNNMKRTNYWDMIIFNKTYKWCLAVTHEDDINGNRLCFAVERNSDSGFSLYGG